LQPSARLSPAVGAAPILPISLRLERQRLQTSFRPIQVIGLPQEFEEWQPHLLSAASFWKRRGLGGRLRLAAESRPLATIPNRHALELRAGVKAQHLVDAQNLLFSQVAGGD
jgi:hypothetical protein